MKVGLLLNRRSIAAWEQGLLTEIVESEFADVVVWIQAPNSRHSSVTSILESKVANFLCRWERSIRIAHDAFHRVSDLSLPSDVALVQLPSHNDPRAPQLLATAISEIRQCDPDVVIALDDHDSMMQFAALGKYGLWHFKHGITAGVSGSPTETIGLREVLNRRPFLESSLIVHSASISSGRQTVVTYSNVNPLSYRRTRSDHFWKVSSIIPRLMMGIRSRGEQALGDKLQSANVEPFEVKSGRRLWSNIRLIFSVQSYLLWRIWAAALRRLTSERWVLMVNSGEDPYDISKYSKIEPKQGWFWADPCLIREDGQNYVFFEEASLESGKGHISVINLHEDGSHSLPRKVLEKDYHLSYPFLFRWQHNLYMIPESAENRTIELYRCRTFPHEWEFERNLMQGLSAYDTTLFEHDGTWWLFANIREHVGASGRDELSLFYNDNPILGEWYPHPLNPIISDVRSARPGGRLFHVDGRIIRPSQDSSYRYGYRLIFNEIVELSKTKYREREYKRIEPGRSWSILGTHTFSHCDGISVIDAFHRVQNLL